MMPPSHTTDRLVVIMPAYNAGRYVREAIDSILAQTFTDFDLLVIDDASTDDTLEHARSYRDPRVHVVARPVNGGLVAVLNQGLDLHKHRFIARMDADDRCAPDRFARQMQHLEAHPDIDLLGTQLEFFGVNPGRSALPTDHADIKAGLLFGSTFPHATLMARSRVFEGERYSARVQHMEDLELWLRLVHRHRFATLPEVLYAYRRHAAGVTLAFERTRSERLRTLLREPLEWLGVAYDDDDVRIMAGDHASLPGGLGASLGRVQALFGRITQANARTGVFDPAALERLLSARWRRTFYLLAMDDLRAVWRYAAMNRGLSTGQLRYFLSTIIKGPRRHA
jgi:glycosyl transferase family 2